MIEKRFHFPTIFIILQIVFMADTSIVYFHWSSVTAIVCNLALTFTYLFINIAVLKKTMHVKGIMFLLILLSINVLSAILNNSSGKDSIILAMVIISAFICVNIFTFEEYIHGYIYTLLFFSIMSLVGLYIFMPMVIYKGYDFFPTVFNKFNVPMVDMGLFYGIKRSGIQRNYGIFREPGVYQFFLLVGISAELFFVKRQKNIKKYIVIIFIITMLSTISTTGLVLLMLIIIAYVFNKSDNKLFMKFMSMLLLVLGIYLIIRFIFPDYYMYLKMFTFEKFNKNTDNISFTVRGESIKNLIKASFMRPLLGWQLENGYNYIIRNFINYGNNDITGTFLIICMALGLPIGITCIFQFYRFCSYLNYSNKNNLTILFIFLALFLSVNTQNLVMNNILWTLIFAPYMSANIKDN